MACKISIMFFRYLKSNCKTTYIQSHSFSLSLAIYVYTHIHSHTRICIPILIHNTYSGIMLHAREADRNGVLRKQTYEKNDGSV